MCKKVASLSADVQESGTSSRCAIKVQEKGIFIYFIIVCEEPCRDINIHGSLNIVGKDFVFQK